MLTLLRTSLPVIDPTGGRRVDFWGGTGGAESFSPLTWQPDPFDSHGGRGRGRGPVPCKGHSYAAGSYIMVSRTPLTGWWLAVRLYLSILNYPRDGSFPPRSCSIAGRPHKLSLIIKSLIRQRLFPFSSLDGERRSGPPRR